MRRNAYGWGNEQTSYGDLIPLDLEDCGIQVGTGVWTPAQVGTCAAGNALPKSLKSLFLKLKRNYLQKGDTDASIKAVTGIGTVVGFDGTEDGPISYMAAKLDVYDMTPVPPEGIRTDEFDDRLLNTVLTFQKAAGIPLTGHLDLPTLGKIFAEVPTPYGESRAPTVRDLSPALAAERSANGGKRPPSPGFWRRDNPWIYAGALGLVIATWLVMRRRTG